MREIEIKAKIDDNTVIVNELKKRGIAVTDPVTQHDHVYGLPGVKGASEQNRPWLRIRTETRGDTVTHLFTFKRSVTNQLDSIEHETVIADDSELASIIHELGFVPYSELTKTRQKARIGDIEVCIDQVEGLGNYIEAERLTDMGTDYAAVIAELWGVLESLGARRSDEVTDGYDVLINKKLGKE